MKQRAIKLTKGISLISLHTKMPTTSFRSYTYTSHSSTSYQNPCQGQGYPAVALIENTTFLICDPNGSAPGLSEEAKLGLGLGLGLGGGLILLFLVGCFCARYKYQIASCCARRSRPTIQRITAEPNRGWNPELQQMITTVGQQNLIHNNLTESLKAELNGIVLRPNSTTHLRAFQEHACEKGATQVVQQIQTLLQGGEMV